MLTITCFHPLGRTPLLFGVTLLLTTGVSSSRGEPGRGMSASRPAGAGVIEVGDGDLQAVLSSAPPHATILCNPATTRTLRQPIRIDKPLTLRGLRARLPDKLGSTPLVVILSPGVILTDFDLTGNGETVSQDDRAPLIEVGAGDFVIERGRVSNSSKDGIMISGDIGGADIVGGVVRDIIGRDVIRDTVSISGSDSGKYRNRNILVDNIRCYHSAKRGAVEVSDGSENITVRKVYAEASLYGIDVQDHRKEGQVNRNVRIEDVHAVRCQHALRTDNRAAGHANLTVRDLTAVGCLAPVQISNTDNVLLSGVRVIDHGELDLKALGISGRAKRSHPVSIQNCRGVTVRDVLVENTEHGGPLVLLEDCEQAIVDGVTLRGRHERLNTGVTVRLLADRVFSNILITHVMVPEVAEAGILLERGKKPGTALKRCVIADNLATVVDRINGAERKVSDGHAQDAGTAARVGDDSPPK